MLQKVISDRVAGKADEPDKNKHSVKMMFLLAQMGYSKNHLQPEEWFIKITSQGLPRGTAAAWDASGI